MYPVPIGKVLPYGLFSLLAAIPAVAAAATTTTTFNVTATVLSACSVSATDLAFGTYTPGSETPNDATSTISVTCTLGTAYNVGLNAGLHGGGDVAARKMEGATAADLLGYGLYSDLLRTTNWGQTVGVDTVAGIGLGLVAAPHIVYGRIPAGQDVSSGAYADTITVTVTY